MTDLHEIDAITRLKYRYMRCLDQKLWAELADCFTEDATTSYGGGKYAFNGRDAIMKFLVEAMDKPSFLSSHRVHHPEIDLTSPTTARGIWALEDFVLDPERRVIIQGAAFYRDEYVKQDGRWRIRSTGYERTFEFVESLAERPSLRITAGYSPANA
jgi:uncharacterized protein (TIGR02246 family)